MTVYSWRNDDGPIPILHKKGANPNTIGKALEKIASVNGGRLTPKATVDAARNKAHVLHKHFEWDDALAAEAYRLDQARALIRLIHVDHDDRPLHGPAFLSVNDGHGVAYHTLGEVIDSADLSMAVLKAAERDLEAFTKRYAALSGVCDIISEARAAVRRRRAEIDSHPEA